MNKKNIYRYLAVLVIVMSANYNGICQEHKAKINYTSFTVNVQ